MSAIVQHTGGGLAEVLQVAQALRQAGGMLPRHFQRDGEIVAVILAGQELGFGPMAALRSIHLVQGKVGLSYDAMIALLRRAKYKISWKSKTAERAHLELTHPDGTTHEEVWDVERAKKARLWGNKGPWTQYPDTMLAARCVSSAARAFAGDVLAGCYSQDEISEIASTSAAVVEEDAHSYDNPEHAAEAERAIKIADAFTAAHLESLEECARVTSDEMQNLEDPADIEAAQMCHADAIRRWFAEHGADYHSAYRSHPKAWQRRSKIRTRLIRWAAAAGLPESFLANAMHVAMAAAEKAEREAAE